MKKLVYLDSCDFSDLSFPDEQLSAENRNLLKELRRQRDGGIATFCLSAIHISEAVHAAAEYKQAAVLRAQLMRDLCDANLRAPTEIFSLELQKAIAGQNARLCLQEIFAQKGEWFGLKLSKDQVPSWRQKAKANFESRIAHLPRRQRRQLRSEFDLSTKKGREKWRELCTAAPRTADLEFPFGLLDRDMFISWLIGEVSDDSLHENFCRIMSDPYILFQHLLDSGDEREAIYAPFRKAGAQMTRNLEDKLKKIFDLFRECRDSGFELPMATIIRNSLSKPEFCRELISAYASTPPSALSDDGAQAIAMACPAFSIFVDGAIAYAYSVLDANIARWRSGSTLATVGKPSDFGDFMHAGYAAYVDVFRCDARFGALLKQNSSIKKKVVHKRAELLSAIEDPTERAA